MTSEEFYRNKLKELNPNKASITLANELITAEQAMRWAHEYNQLSCQELLKEIIGEVEKVYKEEVVHDEKWARGLRYSIKIIKSKLQEDGK